MAISDYLHTINDVLTEAGVELPLPGQSASTPQTRLEHGKAVQGRIIGDDAVNTRARLLAVLTVLVPFIGYPRTLNGLAALNDITGS
jgi:hypothetical protein